MARSLKKDHLQTSASFKESRRYERSSAKAGY